MQVRTGACELTIARQPTTTLCWVAGYRQIVNPHRQPIRDRFSGCAAYRLGRQIGLAGVEIDGHRDMLMHNQPVALYRTKADGTPRAMLSQAALIKCVPIRSGLAA